MASQIIIEPEFPIRFNWIFGKCHCLPYIEKHDISKFRIVKFSLLDITGKLLGDIINVFNIKRILSSTGIGNLLDLVDSPVPQGFVNVFGNILLARTGS